MSQVDSPPIIRSRVARRVALLALVLVAIGSAGAFGMAWYASGVVA